MELTNAIEAIIFVSETPVQEAELIRIFAQEELSEWQAGSEEIRTALAQLMQRYAESTGSFELREIAGGYQFLTRQAYGSLIRALLMEKDKKRLSRAALETLSIIAYRQPISKSEVEYIRGVNCDYAVQKLLEKQLLESAGRSDAPGKPLLYKTSAYFMEYFGIKSLSDLPKLQEIPADEEAYQEQFRNSFHESIEVNESSETGFHTVTNHHNDRISDAGRPERGQEISGRDENPFLTEELEGSFKVTPEIRRESSGSEESETE